MNCLPRPWLHVRLQHQAVLDLARRIDRDTGEAAFRFTQFFLLPVFALSLNKLELQAQALGDCYHGLKAGFASWSGCFVDALAR